MEEGGPSKLDFPPVVAGSHVFSAGAASSPSSIASGGTKSGRSSSEEERRRRGERERGERERGEVLEIGEEVDGKKLRNREHEGGGANIGKNRERKTRGVSEREGRPTERDEDEGAKKSSSVSSPKYPQPRLVDARESAGQSAERESEQKASHCYRECGDKRRRRGGGREGGDEEEDKKLKLNRSAVRGAGVKPSEFISGIYFGRKAIENPTGIESKTGAILRQRVSDRE